MQPPIEFSTDKETPPLATKAGRWTVRRVIKWIVVATILLLAGSYLLLVYRYYAHDVQIKRNYVAELNEPILKIPEGKARLDPLSASTDGPGASAHRP